MKFRYTADEKVLIWLDSFERLTYKQKSELLKLVNRPSELVAKILENGDEVEKVIPAESLQTLKSALLDEDYLFTTLSNLDKKDIFCITLSSSDYPKSLSQTPVPPIVLYGKGNRNLIENEKFGIVGSRKTLSPVVALTKDYAEKISKYFTVVTGLAEGGDEAALLGALKNKNVVSVLAYGFDYVYPTVHTDLLKKVVENGLVLTEHRPSVKPQKFLFPTRNRIIAGLSKGVFIVSAGIKSGASITAEYALEYNRDVFAFPYNPATPSGAGCNKLIKRGANLVDCVEDIFTHYGIEKKAEAEENIVARTLTAEEEKLLQILLDGGETHVEKLIEKSGLPPYLIPSVLSGLEVKGLIVRAGGNKYVAVKEK